MIFNNPPAETVYQTYREKLTGWYDNCCQTNVAILGADISALLAGIFLEDAGLQTVVLTESEQPGDRFILKQGPVPIIHPAEQILHEIDFKTALEAPFWVQRTELLAFCTEKYFAAGGSFLPGVTVERITGQPAGHELQLRLDEQPLVITAEKTLVTTPVAQVEILTEKEGSVHQYMVLNTGLRSEGWIQAGYQAVDRYSTSEELLLVNGAILSGRKAAEVVVSGLEQAGD